tara:strand:- start:8 stop:502 length:495 start_codon:yes stop_codon:yes gene_type:complete
MSEVNSQPELIETVSPPSNPSVIELAEHEELEGDLKEIYDLVYAKVKQIASSGKFTAEHLRPLVLNIVEIVQGYSSDKYDHIDGSQKKAMAMNILRHVIVDLHKNKQMSQQQYEMILLSLEFFGGAIFDLAKMAWKKLVEVTVDISENGTAKCCARNFSRRSKK